MPDCSTELLHAVTLGPPPPETQDLPPEKFEYSSLYTKYNTNVGLVSEWEYEGPWHAKLEITQNTSIFQHFTSPSTNFSEGIPNTPLLRATPVPQYFGQIYPLPLEMQTWMEPGWNGTRFQTLSGALLGVPTASDRLRRLIFLRRKGTISALEALRDALYKSSTTTTTTAAPSDPLPRSGSPYGCTYAYGGGKKRVQTPIPRKDRARR